MELVMQLEKAQEPMVVVEIMYLAPIHIQEQVMLLVRKSRLRLMPTVM